MFNSVCYVQNSSFTSKAPTQAVARRRVCHCWWVYANHVWIKASFIQQGSHRPKTPPRCCHQRSYFKRPKSSPVRPLACNCMVLLRTAYSQAQGCVCTALQLGSDVEQPWLMSKYKIIKKTEVHNVSLRRQKKPRPYVTRIKIWLRLNV